jgi:integrase
MKSRGAGRIFSRKGSALLWCAYYLRGKEFRESTGETDTNKAEKFLKRRLKEVGADQIGAKSFVGPQQERIKVSELLDALEADYKLRGKSSPQNVSNLKRARLDFGLQRACSLTAEQVDSYIERRLQEGLAPASINRVTQVLSQAYKLAIERKHLSSAPKIRHLSEAGNVRQGFFSEVEFRAVLDNLPEDLKDFALFAYYTGMRKGEIASLRWEDVEGDIIRLRAENAKNGKARSVPIEGELADVIERRMAARQVTTDSGVMLAALVFHRDGEPVMDFRKAWATACCMAGLGKLVCPTCKGTVDAEHKCEKCSQAWKREDLKYTGRIFHDFRRTAVRDMVRAGVPETVAMSISGHKTRSMFDRYNIANENDQREAMRATAAYRQQQAAEPDKITAMPQKSASIQ